MLTLMQVSSAALLVMMLVVVAKSLVIGLYGRRPTFAIIHAFVVVVNIALIIWLGNIRRA